MTEAGRFAELQRALQPVLAMNKPGSHSEHVLIVLPSYSVGETLLSHYGPRIPALEHRYLNAMLMLDRIGSCQMIYVSTKPPESRVFETMLGFFPPGRREDIRSRFVHVAADDGSHRAVAAKLLQSPNLLDYLRTLIGNRPVFIEPWNVTVDEVEVALLLGAPINGTAPELRTLGYKSAGRKLLAAAGVPTPCGVEDVRDVDGVIAAIARIRRAHPQALGVVIKHDDSCSGDGNAVIRFASDGEVELRRRIDNLPDWYLADLAKGGIVEELIAGRRFTSPSAQADVLPSGEVVVLATHEQVLGGEGGQVYMGCRFPALPDYAPQLAEYCRAAGQHLARSGVIGRFSIDFAAADENDGNWHIYALEMNLRKGGTTHPYAALRSLVPGHYDAVAGHWRAVDGSSRSYCATDNLVDADWLGLPPRDLLAAMREDVLLFDHRAGTGVVPHMLSCLAIDGRFGITAIGLDAADAERLQEATMAAASRAAASIRQS